ncbi:MAG: peptidylprolyl isomerase [Candidatus Babeliales bacterium]
MISMREKILKSKLYKALLWMILLSMGGGALLVSPLFYKRDRVAPSTIVLVNDQDITIKEFEQKLMQEMERIALLKQQYGEYADTLLSLLGLENPRAIALQTLLYEELLNQVADKLNIRLFSDFVMQKLQDPSALFSELRDIVPMQAITKQGAIDFTALKIILQRQGQSLADFERRIEEALQRKMVTDLVSLSAYISPEEIREYFQDHYLKRKYSVLHFPFEQFLAQARKEQPSDQKLEAFFKEQNKLNKKYWIPEKRSAEIWTFNPESYGLKIQDKEIEEYYKQNKQKKFLENPVQVNVRNILLKADETTMDAVHAKAQKIKEELEKNPEQFEKLVKEYSQDEKAVTKGGETGYFKRGDKNPVFERAAFRLKNNGDISDLVRTQEGIEILQRIDRKPATYKSLESVKNEIQRILLERKFKNKFAQDVQRVVDQSKNNLAAVEKFVKSKQGVKDIIKEKTLDESSLAQKLFKTKKDNWAFFINKEGNGVLLKVLEIQKTFEPELSIVKNKVLEDFYQKQAQEMLKIAMENAKKVSKNQSLKQIKDQYNAELIEVDWLKKDDTEQLQALEKKGIPANQLFFADGTIKKGSITSTYANNDGYLAKIEAIEEFNKTLFEEKQNEIIKNLYQDKKELTTRGFVASLFKNAKIKFIEEQPQTEQIPLDDLIG